MAHPTSVALDAAYLALRLSLPILGTAFVVAALVGFVQTLTQLREPALNAIPRLLGVGLVLTLSATAVSSELLAFAQSLYRDLPVLIQGP